jgi:hypothetical protein
MPQFCKRSRVRKEVADPVGMRLQITRDGATDATDESVKEGRMNHGVPGEHGAS